MTAPGAYVIEERRRLEQEVATLKERLAAYEREREVQRLVWAVVLAGCAIQLEEAAAQELADMECCPGCGEPGYTSTCGACWEGRQVYAEKDVPF